MPAKTTERPSTFDRLQSQKKPLQRKVRIVHDDEAVEAVNEATMGLARAKAGNGPLEDAQAAYDAAMTLLDASSTVLTFRTIGRKAYDRIALDHPATEADHAEAMAAYGGKAPYNPEGFSVALIAASCQHPDGTPVFTEDEVREMTDAWTSAEVMDLFSAALEVNTQRRVVELGKGFG